MCGKTNGEETEPFYFLLLLADTFKAQYRSTDELWWRKEDHTVFRATCTMSKNRFATLKVNLLFETFINKFTNRVKNILDGTNRDDKSDSTTTANLAFRGWIEFSF